MKIYLKRSIALSERTRKAWEDHGGIFLRSDRDLRTVKSWLEDDDYIFNLGDSAWMNYPDDIWTIPNVNPKLKALLYPSETRQLLGDMLPPRPDGEYPCDVWIKPPGRAGKGKFTLNTDGHLDNLPRWWDWQKHVEGQEFRVLTVGNRVIQDFARYGENGERSYQWTPMREVPQEVKDLARRAAETFEGINIIAWDIIHGDEGTYLFEGNTCPGVNHDTVGRIINEYIRQRREYA